MSKQFCPSCGAEITGGGSFCPACGKAIAQEQPPIQEPAAAQEQNPAQEQPRPQQPYAAPYPAGGAPQYGQQRCPSRITLPQEGQRTALPPFLFFQTAGSAEKIHRKAKTQLCGVALIIP